MTTKATMWGGRFASQPSPLLRALNDSFAFDRELLAEDVQGSMAWADALANAGVLTADERDAIAGALDTVGRLALSPLEDSFEDVHSYVESKLRELVGPLAGKLHAGRSRNDQVATDLRLWLKRACTETSTLAEGLVRSLATVAGREASTAMPGYTHSKQAEPITFGHWCLAYAQMLKRDISRLGAATNRADECPLGSGALAGTPLPIDRLALAHSLGFARATANSLDAVSDRDLGAEYLFASSLMLSHLSRLAEDLIFFTSDEAGFAELPDSMATGSSRMPQKKNPDVLELTRGYAARSIGELTGFLALLKGLPLAYDKDLQLDKEPLFRTRDVLKKLLPAMAMLIDGLQLNVERMRAASTSDALVATAVADAIAATGVPFRDAHDQVSWNLASLPELARQHGVTLESTLAKKDVFGGTAPNRVHEAALAMLRELS